MSTLTDELAPGSNAQGFIPTLTANQLRYLGEKADGLRAKPLSLVIVGEKVDVIETKKLTSEMKPLLNLATPGEGPGVKGDAKIQIKWRGKVTEPGKDFDKADAVFVTQSAVEKFLLPYYLRFRTPAEVAALKIKLFDNKDVAAAFHIPPSIALPYPGGASGGAGQTDESESDLGEVGWVGIDSSKPESDKLTAALM